VGRIICVVYDDCGKFRGFSLWEEGKGERKFKATESGLEGLVRKAWEEKWCVEIMVEEGHEARRNVGEMEVAKGIILQRGI
jgi:hypothetical protein